MKKPRKTAEEKAREAQYEFEVYGSIDLRGQWYGWRIRRRELITPNRQRIGIEQLAAVIYFQKTSERQALKRIKAGHQGGVVVAIEQFRKRARSALAEAAKR